MVSFSHKECINLPKNSLQKEMYLNSIFTVTKQLTNNSSYSNSAQQVRDLSWAVRQKNMRQRYTFLGSGGSGSSLKPHSLIFRPILRKSAIVIFRQQFKTFDSNNFTLSSMFSFQHVWPMKRKANTIFDFSKHSSSCRR